MLGKKNEPKYPWNEPEGVAEHEYYVVAAIGADNFVRDANSLAKRGWELINGSMAGTAHFGYFRRRVKS